MSNATNQAVLVLNSSWEPISIVAARRALALIVKDKAVVQEHNGREAHVGIMFPTVLRLREFAHIPHRTQIISRRNILLRDRHQCMYCGKKPGPHALTLDHIIPRSQGGPNTWANLVSCCERCNRFKANRTPEEAGMTLIRKPRPSTIHTSRFILRTMGAEDEQWRKYLFYDSAESSAVSRGVPS